MAVQNPDENSEDVSIARFLPALVVFLVTLIAVPVIEIFHGTPGEAVDVVDWSRDKVMKGESTKAFEIALEEKSLFAEKVRPLQSALLFQLFQEATPKVLVGPNNWLFQAGATENFPRRGKEDLIDRHAEAIVGMVRYLESRGTRVILVPVPPKWALHPEELPDLTVKPYSVTPRMLARFKDERIEAIDLISEFKKAPFRCYVPNDTHFSPEGSDLVARLVAERTKEIFKKSLPGPEIDLDMVIDEETPHEGDLQRMLGLDVESDLYRSLHVPERKSRIVHPDSGRTYRAESVQDLVWCGTSYSHVGDMAERLTYHLHREVEDQAVPGQGPTVTLLENVVAKVQAGERKAPRLIVWEYPEKHVFVRVSSFLEPLKAFLLKDARGDDIEIVNPSPLVYDSVEPKNVELKQESDGAISGTPTTPDPYLIFKLGENLEAEPNSVLVYQVTAERKTTSYVMFDFGSGFTRDESLRVAIPGGDRPARVVVPLPTRAIQRIRLDPVDTKIPFLLERVSVASRKEP